MLFCFVCGQDIIETCSQSPFCKVPDTATLTTSDTTTDTDTDTETETETDPQNHIGIVDSAVRVLLGDTFGEISEAEEWEKLGVKGKGNVWSSGWGVREWMLVEKWSKEPERNRNFQCSCSS